LNEHTIESNRVASRRAPAKPSARERRPNVFADATPPTRATARTRTHTRARTSSSTPATPSRTSRARVRPARHILAFPAPPIQYTKNTHHSSKTVSLIFGHLGLRAASTPRPSPSRPPFRDASLAHRYDRPTPRASSAPRSFPARSDLASRVARLARRREHLAARRRRPSRSIEGFRAFTTIDRGRATAHSATATTTIARDGSVVRVFCRAFRSIARVDRSRATATGRASCGRLDRDRDRAQVGGQTDD